jgi:Fe-S-cluster-containing dehydrogenase component
MYDRLKKNEQPGCTAVCPTGAVFFGKRTDLLAKAKERVAASPGKYFENRVELAKATGTSGLTSDLLAEDGLFGRRREAESGVKCRVRLE